MAMNINLSQWYYYPYMSRKSAEAASGKGLVCKCCNNWNQIGCYCASLLPRFVRANFDSSGLIGIAILCRL